jgi:hypothetical protein
MFAKQRLSRIPQVFARFFDPIAARLVRANLQRVQHTQAEQLAKLGRAVQQHVGCLREQGYSER